MTLKHLALEPRLFGGRQETRRQHVIGIDIARDDIGAFGGICLLSPQTMICFEVPMAAAADDKSI